MSEIDLSFRNLCIHLQSSEIDILTLNIISALSGKTDKEQQARDNLIVQQARQQVNAPPPPKPSAVKVVMVDDADDVDEDAPRMPGARPTVSVSISIIYNRICLSSVVSD